jgi:hypothetical protein
MRNGLGHFRRIDGDDHHNKDTATGKRAVVAARAF